MISNKYKIIEIINHGSFGSIFKCINTHTNKLVAIKTEPKDTDKKTLKNEARIYQYLGNTNGFPQLQYFGATLTHNYLVMDLLGTSLSSMIKRYQTLSLKTVLFIGIQIINRIQTLHSKFLLHRDIKTDNFVFENKQPTNKLYLIDLGFSKRYTYDGLHIPENSINTIIGTPNFVSLNNHNGVEPSRRDDLESAIYIILNMFFGNLEWFNYINIFDIVKLKKKLILQPNTPPFIKTMLHYVISLRFNELPDYNFIINIMNDLIQHNGYKNDNVFEWTNDLTI